MGISAAVCIFSIYLSRDRYSPPRPAGSVKNTDTGSKNTDTGSKGSLILEMMLEENHKISFPKFQMFIWTWILIAIYLIGFFLQAYEIVTDVQDNGKVNNLLALNIPDIHPAFVIIMAVSQGAFIGNSLMSQRTIRIISVVSAGSKNEIISIFGDQLWHYIREGGYMD